MNLNNSVWVRLTPSGLKILEKHGPLGHAPTETGWYELPLWKLMTVFGPVIRLVPYGAYIVSNEVIFSEPE